MRPIATRAVVAVAVALTCAATSACSLGGKTPTPLKAADLQKSLSDKLIADGTPATSVNCKKDLPGDVGRTARCDVTFNPYNSVSALLTTTEVNGDTINYEITRPEMSKEQLAKRVGAVTASRGVTCTAGLDGQVGDWADCQGKKLGAPVHQTVKVSNVRGLVMQLTVTPVIPQQQLAELLVAKFVEKSGTQPDRIVCDADLLGEVGFSTQCAVTVAGTSDKYWANVTGVNGQVIDFDYSKDRAGAVGAR